MQILVDVEEAHDQADSSHAGSQGRHLQVGDVELMLRWSWDAGLILQLPSWYVQRQVKPSWKWWWCYC